MVMQISADALMIRSRGQAGQAGLAAVCDLLAELRQKLPCTGLTAPRIGRAARMAASLTRDGRYLLVANHLSNTASDLQSVEATVSAPPLVIIVVPPLS